MRALLGPLNRVGHGAVLADLQGLDVLSFDRSDADVAFDPAREPLPALFARLPPGFVPDCLIWWSPEYSALPAGIERCPVPSIAVLGDWNLGLWTTAPLLEAFDWVVTDRMGVRQLAPQLDVPVDHWRAFSFDTRVHRRPAGGARDIDVLFVGNLNHDVQHERAPWLLRLARIPGRRVHVAAGVYGGAYAELLGRARIVWNRSIRGELNMRAYEATACGALLFMEAENLEVRDVFADGESCVLYDAAGLEARFERYLDRPQLVERIAEAGWRRVQRETYRAHLETLLAGATRLRVGPRRFGALPPWRRDYWLGLHALASSDPGRTGAALAHLLRAAATTDDSGAVTAALGAVGMWAALEHPDGAERRQGLETAAALFEAAIAAHGDDVVSRTSLATTRAALGDFARARAGWLSALDALRRDEPFPVDRIPAPFSFDRFRVEWERASEAAELTERMARFRVVLRARVTAALAKLEGDAMARVESLSESVAAFPGVDDNLRRLADTLAEAGEDATALQTYRHALDLNPLDWAARTAAVQLASARGDGSTVAALAADAESLTMARRLPSAPAPLAAATPG